MKPDFKQTALLHQRPHIFPVCEAYDYRVKTGGYK